MTNQFDQFKDVSLSNEMQSATTGGRGKAAAYQLMLKRMKSFQTKAKKTGNSDLEALHERERCKLEFSLYRTW